MPARFEKGEYREHVLARRFGEVVDGTRCSRDEGIVLLKDRAVCRVGIIRRERPDLGRERLLILSEEVAEFPGEALARFRIAYRGDGDGKVRVAGELGDRERGLDDDRVRDRLARAATANATTVPAPFRAMPHDCAGGAVLALFMRAMETAVFASAVPVSVTERCESATGGALKPYA